MKLNPLIIRHPGGDTEIRKPLSHDGKRYNRKWVREVVKKYNEQILIQIRERGGLWPLHIRFKLDVATVMTDEK